MNKVNLLVFEMEGNVLYLNIEHFYYYEDIPGINQIFTLISPYVEKILKGGNKKVKKTKMKKSKKNKTKKQKSKWGKKTKRNQK